MGSTVAASAKFSGRDSYLRVPREQPGTASAGNVVKWKLREKKQANRNVKLDASV